MREAGRQLAEPIVELRRKLESLEARVAELEAYKAPRAFVPFAEDITISAKTGSE